MLYYRHLALQNTDPQRGRERWVSRRREDMDAHKIRKGRTGDAGLVLLKILEMGMFDDATSHCDESRMTDATTGLVLRESLVLKEKRQLCRKEAFMV